MQDRYVGHRRRQRVYTVAFNWDPSKVQVISPVHQCVDLHTDDAYRRNEIGLTSFEESGMLSRQQLDTYRRSGLLFIDACIPPQGVARLVQAASELAQVRLPGHVYEKHTRVLRGMHDCHHENEAFAQLTRCSELAVPAKQILESDVYVYQCKLNLKSAFVGDAWPWHQDFIYWSREDGLRHPALVNAVVYLDNVTQYNSPMYFLPCSHQRGTIQPGVADRSNEPSEGAYREWQANFAANLKWQVSNEEVTSLAHEFGIASFEGGAGSVVFFHPNVVHCSPPNISPNDRRLAIITYNDTQNLPAHPRSEFLVSSDAAAIVPTVARW